MKMCYRSSHHCLLVTLCFSHLPPGMSHPRAGISLPSHSSVSAQKITVCSTMCYQSMPLNFEILLFKAITIFLKLRCSSEKQLIPITCKCFQGLLSVKDHQKLLIRFKSMWKLFNFRCIGVKVSPRRCPMESSSCLGGASVKLGRAVGLVSVWRCSLLEGVQDLSTLASPGVTGWSWPGPSTAPGRPCDSRSAKGCYEDAISSALRDKFQKTPTQSPPSLLENRTTGRLGVLPGIWANMLPSTTFRRFPLRASWDSLAMLLNTSGGRCCSSLFLKNSS